MSAPKNKGHSGQTKAKSNSDKPTCPAPVCIVLDGYLDISNVGDLHARLKAALQERQPIVINANKVERVDTAALQTFIAFSKAAQREGMTFQWQGRPSETFCDSAKVLGLGDILGLAD
ncbi:MAG TPA: STAS domain-containing protein [Gammaproteobacteria bacterium]|nr:STAS domain-containing protein [Gammaproteobacteria bacterium]